MCTAEVESSACLRWVIRAAAGWRSPSTDFLYSPKTGRKFQDLTWQRWSMSRVTSGRREHLSGSSLATDTAALATVIFQSPIGRARIITDATYQIAGPGCEARS